MIFAQKVRSFGLLISHSPENRQLPGLIPHFLGFSAMVCPCPDTARISFFEEKNPKKATSLWLYVAGARLELTSAIGGLEHNELSLYKKIF